MRSEHGTHRRHKEAMGGWPMHTRTRVQEKCSRDTGEVGEVWRQSPCLHTHTHTYLCFYLKIDLVCREKGNWVISFHCVG